MNEHMHWWVRSGFGLKCQICGKRIKPGQKPK